VVPRAEFDHRLLSAALAAGAEFRQRTVRAIDRRPDRVVVDGEFAGTVLIGADGANSIVRRFLGEAPNRGRHVVLAVRGYVPSPAGFEELYLRWDPSPGDRLGYAWAFPTAHGTVNVGYGSAGPGQNKASLVGRAAALLPGFAVEAAEMTGHLLPLSTHRPRPAAGNVLMVGDAASLINPLTGEGIFYALVSGALAGRAAVRPEAAERYSQALQVRFGRHHRQTRLLAQFVDRPGVMSAALRACSRDERVFARLLSVGLADGSFSVGELAWFAFAALAVRADRPRTGHDR
jgi:menaquinone-9 beta-reductase